MAVNAEDATVESQLPGTSFFLPTERISFYDHNARLVPNPEKPRLKTSIAASGRLMHPLVVTKRPGSDQFMVHQGGNTRLEILQELAQETPADDTRFDRTKVIYESYTSEMDIAVNHDRENNMRGDLSFIEQARAKCYQFELFAAHAENGQKINATTFTAYLEKHYGDDLSLDRFSRMRYAVDVLYEWIPTMLVQGRMALGAVRELVGFRLRLFRVWADHDFGDKRGFDAIFYPLLGRQDEEHRRVLENATTPSRHSNGFLKIDYFRLRQAFQNELTEMDDVQNADFQTIGLWIGAALNSDDLDQFEAVADLDTEVPAAAASNSISTKAPRKKPTKRKSASDLPAAAVTHGSDTTVTEPLPATTDIKSLRGRCYTLALKIAQRNGFAELIEMAPSAGHGFVVTDIFPDHWWDTLPKDELHRRQTCWWLLAMCSHTLDLPEGPLKTKLPDGSMLRDAWMTHDVTLVSRTMGLLGVNTHLSSIENPDWEDFLVLLSSYRQLIASANGSENLW